MPSEPEEGLKALELGLQVVMSLLIQELGTEPWSSANAASTLNL